MCENTHDAATAIPPVPAGTAAHKAPAYNGNRSGAALALQPSRPVGRNRQETKMKKLLTVFAAAATVVMAASVSIAPAQAGGYGYGHGHHYNSYSYGHHNYRRYNEGYGYNHYRRHNNNWNTYRRSW